MSEVPHDPNIFHLFHLPFFLFSWHSLMVLLEFLQYGSTCI